MLLHGLYTFKTLWVQNVFMLHAWDDEILNKLTSKSGCLQFVHLCFLRLKSKLVIHDLRK